MSLLSSCAASEIAPGDHRAGSAADGWLVRVAADQSVTCSACRLAIVLTSMEVDGVIIVGLRDLADRMGCTPRGVGKQMACLISTGHVLVNRGRGRGRKNTYSLVAAK
jgi:hypothetical protein